jgi:hypothetical protein
MRDPADHRYIFEIFECEPYLDATISVKLMQSQGKETRLQILYKQELLKLQYKVVDSIETDICMKEIKYHDIKYLEDDINILKKNRI